MATYTKKILSGTTNGKPLSILGATTSGGTLVHTAVTATGANNGDEVWLWATNYVSTTGTITVSFGGTADAERVHYSVTAQDGLYLVVPGLILNAGLEVRCHASASNTLSVVGYVNTVAT
jgi:hypothetical protein